MFVKKNLLQIGKKKCGVHSVISNQEPGCDQVNLCWTKDKERKGVTETRLFMQQLLCVAMVSALPGPDISLLCQSFLKLKNWFKKRARVTARAERKPAKAFHFTCVFFADEPDVSGRQAEAGLDVVVNVSLGDVLGQATNHHSVVGRSVSPVVIAAKNPQNII